VIDFDDLLAHDLKKALGTPRVLVEGESMGTRKYVRLAWISAAALMAGAAMSEGQAGGFAVREQSTQFEGTSFAGDAAGGALSSMFWNPAAAAAKDGINTESSYTLAFPSTSIEATGGILANTPFLSNNGGSFGSDALIPASYANYQVNDRLYLGFAMNSPFGFTVKPENYWAGSPINGTSRVFSIDLNPDVAFKLTPEITLGAGLQVEYLHLHATGGALPAILQGAFGLGGLPPLTGRGTDLAGWGVGATTGALWQPSERTSIGLGYRSPIDFDLTGDCKGFGLTNLQAASPLGCLSNPSVHGKITTPDTLTLSARQQVTERLALLGTIEWTGWSRTKGSFSYNTAGVAVDALPVSFDDSWFYAVGAEYKYSPFLTLRAGLSYEKAPVTDANRTQFLPDADRWTPSVGASYKWSDRITVDFAYSHIFFKDAPLTETGLGFTLLQADAKTDIDLVSVGLKYKLAGPPALEPFK
jgi:long-chain fatty acid transport protein